MFSRIMAALLVITLTACSTTQRDTTRGSPSATHAASAATASAVDAGEAPENNDEARGADARQDRGAVKIVVMALVIALAALVIAAASRGLSRDIAKSCYRP